MPLYKPSELRQFLTELNVSPKKVLSQNFLIDGNIIRKIVETANVTADDVVLEVGPGPGALSEALLQKGAHVIAVEKDRMLAKALERLKSPENHLDVFCDDIMEFPIEQELTKCLAKGQKGKVIANLPYHLTTPILVHLVPLNHIFSSLYLMVQEEVARRFTAKPGTKEYGSLTIFLNFFTRPKYAFQVSNQCFFPKPSVQSAVVILELREPPQVDSVENFFKLTRTAFQHRRKMLRGSLRELHEPKIVEEALERIGVSPQSRPEELSLDQWLALYAKLNA